MKQNFITLNQTKLNYYTWGSVKNPPLILVHGWMDSGASFHFICEKLKKYFYCIAPDLRGYGHSAHSHNGLGYYFYDYVADLDALINHFSPKKPVHLLGHSLGGNVVSIYAGAKPDRVSHLINLEGFGLRRTTPADGPPKAAKWLNEIKEVKKARPYKTKKDIAARLQETYPFLSQNQTLFLAQYHSKKTKQGFVFSADPRHKWSEPYLFSLENLFPFWEKISAKTLLISAEKSEMGFWIGTDQVEAELKTRFAHFPKESVIVQLKDCGHMIHLQKPDELVKEILNFLV